MANPKYKPLGDRVLVEPEVAEQTTKSGIVIPDSAQEKPQSGTVVRVGAGRVTEEGKTIPLSIKEGDVIIFSKYGGSELKLEDQTYMLVKESDVLAIRES